jgi:hypothetical protein
MMEYAIQDLVWGNTVESIANKPCGNNIWSVIRRLCLGATLYFIWQERNFKIFRDE